MHSDSPASIVQVLGPFAVRLRDLLATLESAALLGAAAARVRGLGEHLRFACLALPCDEALVALELEALGRLRVPVVADAEGFRTTELDFLPSGTPFAYLLGGGGGHAADLAPGDYMVAALRPVLSIEPGRGVFVPIRIGESIVGGAALLTRAGAALGEGGVDRQLEMAERLGEVLALTVESFRTERILFELFARALPDLLAGEAPTSLGPALGRHIHALRVTPAYRRRLELATQVGRLADRGEPEAALAGDVIARFEGYLRGLEGVEPR